MYGVASTVALQTTLTRVLRDLAEQEIAQVISRQPGCRACYGVARSATEIVVVHLWESQRAADASAESIALTLKNVLGDELAGVSHQSGEIAVHTPNETEAAPVDPRVLQWPAVSAAHEYVRPGYDWLLRRLDAVENRVRNIATLAGALTFAVPAFITATATANPGLSRSFTANSFLAAGAAFVAIVVCAALSTVPAKFTLVDPEILYDTMLEYSEWEFKKNMLYYAIQDFADNANLVRYIGRLARAMGILLIVEAVLLAIWAAGLA